MSSSVCVSHRNWFWMRNNISEDIFPLLRMFLFLSPTAQPSAGPAAFRHKQKRRARASVPAAEGRPRGSRGRGAAALSPLDRAAAASAGPGCRSAGAASPSGPRGARRCALRHTTPHVGRAVASRASPLPSHERLAANPGRARPGGPQGDWKLLEEGHVALWGLHALWPLLCGTKRAGAGAPPRGKAGKDTAAGTM